MNSLKELEKKFLQTVCGKEIKPELDQPAGESASGGNTTNNPVEGSRGSTEQPVESKADKPAEQKTTCPTCNETEWWIDIHGGGPHCYHCKRPAVRSFVKWQYFLDDHGCKWNVTVGKKVEVWRKEC